MRSGTARRALLLLNLSRPRSLPFNPIAAAGVLRKNQQQRVLLEDGIVDLALEATGLGVLLVAPGVDAFLLESLLQAFDEELILVGVRNEFV